MNASCRYRRCPSPASPSGYCPRHARAVEAARSAAASLPLCTEHNRHAGPGRVPGPCENRGTERWVDRATGVERAVCMKHRNKLASAAQLAELVELMDGFGAVRDAAKRPTRRGGERA